jgi:hypothetical protein
MLDTLNRTIADQSDYWFSGHWYRYTADSAGQLIDAYTSVPGSGMLLFAVVAAVCVGKAITTLLESAQP